MSTENRIDYVEIPVTDLKKTRDFFSSSLGWSFQEVFSFPGGRRFDFIDPVGTEYAMWSASVENKNGA